MTGRVGRALAIGVLVVALAGCSGVAPEPSPSPTPIPTGPYAVVALGDSITVAQNSCERQGPCEQNSWATGDDPAVDSVATRIAATGREVSAVNLAVAGRRIDGLADQVAQLQPLDARVVTVLIGANDACSASAAGVTSAAEFAQSATGLVDSLAAAAPQALVYVASVPDLSAFAGTVGADPSAQARWERYGLCPSALADPESTAPEVIARRAALRERIAAFNSALADACATSPQCVWDDGDVFDFPFDKPALSTIDVFHPSVAGQAELAAIAWSHLEDRLP